MNNEQYNKLMSDGSRHDDGLTSFLKKQEFEDYLLKVRYHSYRPLGEIDAYAEKDGELYLIEYKTKLTTSKFWKGQEQLLRAYEHGRLDHIKTHMLLAWGEDNYMEIISDTPGWMGELR